MTETILNAIARADMACGVSLSVNDDAGEPITSVRLNARGDGRDVAIEFDNGIKILTDVLCTASIDENSQITIPGRARFRLYRKTLVLVGSEPHPHPLADDVYAAAKAFLGNGGHSEGERDAFEAGLVAALRACTAIPEDILHRVAVEVLRSRT